MLECLSLMEYSPMTKMLYAMVAMVGLTATGIMYYEAFSNPKGASVTLKIGDPAPDFELQSQTGETVRLSGFRHLKNVVLYFYPKDNTPSCTTEACNFQNDLAQFASRNTEVLGVSLDSVDSHRRFARKYNLNFDLLSDTDRVAAKEYGVLGSLMGFKYAKRTTFVIDNEGIIRNIFQQVSVDKHNAEVWAAIQRLPRG